MLKKAGAAVLTMRSKGLETRLKKDASPVTAADLEGEAIIRGALGRICPKIPIIGEESFVDSATTAAASPTYFLVDPIDGTREFIAGRDDFAVNIAVVEQGFATLGIAFREMGHALVAVATASADPVHKVSIIPRSIGALGYTMQRPTEDRFLITTGELKGRMIVLMGGRAAEEIIFGEVSTGAADDLAKVTDIARQCVTRFGMDETVGQAVLEEQRLQWLADGPGSPHQKDYSEATAREVDLAVRGMIDAAFVSAKKMLTAKEAELRAGAQLLLEKETLTPDDFVPLRRAAELLPVAGEREFAETS